MDTPLPLESAPYDSHWTQEHSQITFLACSLYTDGYVILNYPCTKAEFTEAEIVIQINSKCFCC